MLPNGTPVERFVKFLELHSHGAEDMSNQIFNLIDNFGLEIEDCRALSTFLVLFNLYATFSVLQRIDGKY